MTEGRRAPAGPELEPAAAAAAAAVRLEQGREQQRACSLCSTSSTSSITSELEREGGSKGPRGRGERCKSRHIDITPDTRDHQPAFAGEAGESQAVESRERWRDTLTARHLMTSGIFLLHSWRERERENEEAVKQLNVNLHSHH